MASRGWIGLFKFHSICPVWFEYWFYVLLKHFPDIVRWLFYVTQYKQALKEKDFTQ